MIPSIRRPAGGRILQLLLILPIVALLTSILSGVIGMGGGMLLLATMFAFMSHAEAIPAHGAVQLISNSTRTFVFLRCVHLEADRDRRRSRFS